LRLSLSFRAGSCVRSVGTSMTQGRGEISCVPLRELHVVVKLNALSKLIALVKLRNS
jgi:hypothetical protein